MEIPPDFHLTNVVFWWSALAVGVVDGLFLALLTWRIPPERWRSLQHPLIAVTMLFWGLLWLWVLLSFWETVYRLVFPAELRFWLPLLMALFYALLAWSMSWLAGQARLPPLAFVLLGMALGVLTHLWAIGRGILMLPPMLQGLDPVPVLLFAAVEYGFYWCLILTLTALGSAILARLRKRS